MFATAVFATTGAMALMSGSGSMTVGAARRLLDVEADAEPEALKSARNRAMMSAHPDHGGSEDALRRIVEAYAILTGETKAAPEGAETLEITPTVAVNGGRHVTRLADGRKIAVVLPAGLRNGDKVQAGGALMTVIIRGRPEVFVSGDDLCMLIKASPALMANGGKLKIRTPAGHCVVWIPVLTGSNRIVRVLGRGLPPRGRHPQGALILKLSLADAAQDTAGKRKPARGRAAA